MDAKQIRVTVSGPAGVGKTAVIEFLARCLLEAGIPAVFDPESLNVLEERNAGLTTEEMNERLKHLVDVGDRYVVLKEVTPTYREHALALEQTPS